MFKVGDKVICISNDNGNLYLTIGKEYVVLDFNSEEVDVYNDINIQRTYYNCRFKLKESPVEFQVGDIVEFGGVEGKVSIIDYEWSRTYPLRVDFKENIYYFTKDGKYNILHTKPLLNLVSRPKKKEKRLVKTTVQYSPSLDQIFDRNEVKTPSDLIVVELEKEIEVEV